MNKRVLITGAGGYIGTLLVPLLLKNKFKVVALDRFYFGKKSNRSANNFAKEGMFRLEVTNKKDRISVSALRFVIF